MASLKLKHSANDPVRLSFPDLFDAVQYEGAGPFRYNATVLVKPGGANDKAIRAAIDEALVEEYGKKAEAAKKSFEGSSNKNCYMPGDKKEYDGYAGMMALTGHRKQKDGRPGIFDCTRAGPDGKPAVLAASDGKPYAGCYVNFSADIYAQSGTNAGIRCGLKGVFFATDGDAFSGSKSAPSDDFDIEEGADSDDLA